jgi:predicted ATP-dependent serine protease
MRKEFSFTELATYQFSRYDLSAEWTEVLGKIEHGFHAIIWGGSGSGKTTFALKMCGELTKFGRVYYNALEQGFSGSLQDNAKAACLTAEQLQKIRGVTHTFEEMMADLKKNRAKFIFIDSVQYMGKFGMTYTQYKEMKEFCKKGKKSIIMISHAEKDNPKGNHAKAIRYDVDIKIRASAGVALAESRYGATKPFVIYVKKEKNNLFG